MTAKSKRRPKLSDLPAGPERAPALREPKRRADRIAVLMLGLVIPQGILFGPSLVGARVLLPLDILEWQGMYLTHPDGPRFWPENPILSDQIRVLEPWRRFAVDEVRAGRLPLWNPYIFCGAPFLAANQSAVFSPFRALDYLFPGTWIIAWTVLAKSLVAGWGAYLFFRRALATGFWAAALGAWAFPLSGAMIQWLGYPISHVLAWLPWLLLCTDMATRNPRGCGGPGLALATAAALFSGHAATAVQAFLAVVLYAAFVLAQMAVRRSPPARVAAGGLALAGGLLLGTLISAPQTLPTAEYLRFSHRLAQRHGGLVETAPAGWRALAQLVLADGYGSERRGDAYLLTDGNRLESAAAGYTGAVVALLFAPLALFDARRRSAALFWLAIAIVAAGQVLDLPGLRAAFQAYPLSSLRNNRLVFLTGWAVLVLAVLGFDGWTRDTTARSRWCWLPVALCAAVLAWFSVRAASPPALLASAVARTATEHFVRVQISGALLATAAIALWAALAARWKASAWASVGVMALVIGELVWSAYGFNPQTDPALDYPTLSVVRQLQRLPKGRVCGAGCLLANLGMVFGLSDIRGYDAVDPAHYIELIDCFRANFPQPRSNPAAATSMLIPRPSPLLDMLHLRYTIHRGAAGPGSAPIARGDGYVVYENKTVLPRVFVPRRVARIADKEERLRALARPDFDPRAVAYVETDLALPSEAQGRGRIVREEPCQLTINVEMETPGCVVLADLWYPGWHASVDGRPAPVLRVNHALRGVVVPRGKHELTFRFQPRSFYRGVWLAAAGSVACLAWSVAAYRPTRHSAGGAPPAK